MAKECEKRIRDAFATWLRTSTDLVTLATSETNIRADNKNAAIPVPGVTFSMNTTPLTDAPDVFSSYVSITCANTKKDLMLDMLGAIKELCNPSSGSQRDARFANDNVASMGIAFLGSDEVETTTRGASTGTPLESVFQGEATVRLIWRDLS